MLNANNNLIFKDGITKQMFLYWLINQIETFLKFLKMIKFSQLIAQSLRFQYSMRLFYNQEKEPNQFYQEQFRVLIT